MTKFERSEDWSEEMLLVFSKRHLSAAEALFCNKDIQTYTDIIFSAGYLCHLGIELLLKAWWLHNDNYFEDKHDLFALKKKVNLILMPELEVYFKNINQFYDYRYPIDTPVSDLHEYEDIDGNYPGEIGDQDWVGTIKVLHKTIDQMPESLQKIAKPIFSKFDNALGEKKFIKNGKYYRLVLDV